MDILDFKTNTGFNEIKSCETDKDGMILSSKEQYAAGLSVKQLWLSDKTAFWYIVGTRCRQMLENTENLPMCSQSREPHPDRQSPECTRAMHWR